MTTRTKEIIGLAVVMAVTIFFCLFHIKESPPVWFDEGIYIQAAANLASSGVVGFIVAPDEIVTVPQLSVGYPLLYPLAAVFKIFGVGVLQARLLMVLFIIGLVAAAYILMRMIYGRTCALWSASLLALFPPIYGTGKSVLGEIPGTFFFVLALIFFIHAVMSYPGRRRTLRIVSAGLCLGLAVVTKPVFILILPTILIAGLVTWRRWSSQWRTVTIGMVSLILPIFVWLLTQFIQSGSLTETLLFYSNPSNADIGTMLIAALGNVRHFFTDVGPFMLAIMMIAWSVSIGLRLRNKTAVPFVEIGSFIFCIISVAAFLRTYGYYRYLLPYQILALIFFPNALKVTLNAFEGKSEEVKWFGWPKSMAVSGVIVAMLALGAYQLMFDSWVADAYGSDRTTRWERYFSSQDIKRPVFYYNVPEVAIFDTEGDYYQYIIMAPATDISVGGEHIPSGEKSIYASIFIETDTLQSIDDQIIQKYKAIEEVGKYTILEKLP